MRDVGVMFITILSILLLAVLSYQVSAVSVTTRGVRNQAIFGIEFPKESRTYYGSEAGVQSISTQEYITTNFRVIELNIVTQGSALLRIYYSRPLRPGELQQAISDGLGATGIPGGSSIIQRPLPPLLVPWPPGSMVLWFFGPLVLWFFGSLVLWSFGP